MTKYLILLIHLNKWFIVIKNDELNIFNFMG